MSLWDRVAAVEFGTRGGSGRRIEGLRVAFDVQLSKTGAANKAKITIYNLAPASVSLLQRPDAVVRLYAGYRGTDGLGIPHLLIEAELVPAGVTSTKMGPDRVTVIEVADGGPQLSRATVSQEFAGVPTAQDLLDSVTGALGFGEGSVTLPSLDLTEGMSLFGSATDVLDRLAQGVGGTWWVDNGTVSISPYRQPTTGTAVVLSAANRNLVGSPTIKADGIEATALLDASIRPGSWFRVISDQVPGRDYVATDVRYNGDTHGQPWYVTVQGVPLG